MNTMGEFPIRKNQSFVIQININDEEKKKEKGSNTGSIWNSEMVTEHDR